MNDNSLLITPRCTAPELSGYISVGKATLWENREAIPNSPDSKGLTGFGVTAGVPRVGVSFMCIGSRAQGRIISFSYEVRVGVRRSPVVVIVCERDVRLTAMGPTVKNADV